ncbi:protein kinase [Sansalvadorimonas sp. 2012CJ34-2]|uniref:Protein kinase n=1 Tax=Parendozoicomonas callyspongiae TaxID=2942213 RepID=A0ABT0PIB3_9GAMM|nr:protein kinase [Sansalvadorimonas sp. 2012CJ34-2]MCL6271095.1 protein kinase [Sansalvadorimonas sp. 2012CJ34-2]
MSRYQLSGPVFGRFTREVRDTLTGCRLVMKGPFSPSPLEERFAHESKVLSQLNIEGVVGLRNCLRAPRRCWLIMDRLPGNSLDKVSIAPERAGWLIARIARLLALCHQKSWVHGDICPGNIQVNGRKVWLLDFGAALPLGKRYPVKRQMRPVWSSPTLINGSGKVSTGDDVYSLMLLGCSLLSGSRRACPKVHSGCRWQRPGRLSRRQWRFISQGLERPETIHIHDLVTQALGW